MKCDSVAELAVSALAAVDDALDGGSVRALATDTVLLQLSPDADLASAITAVRTCFTPQALRVNPVGLWHGLDHHLVGPAGVLCPTALVPANRSLGTRVYPSEGGSVRVVISWLNGPTRDEVAARLADQPDSGLTVELIREDFDILVQDVVDAAITATGDPRLLAAHPVLARVGAFRDGLETYYELLDLVAVLWPKVKRRRARRRYYGILRAIAQLGDHEAVGAVLDDVGIRVLGGEFLPVRPIADDAILAAVFVLLALVSRALTPGVVRATRQRMTAQ